MKKAFKIFLWITSVISVVIFHALFFLHHPPEVQLAFLTPGITLIAYSVIRDDFYMRPSRRSIALKKDNIFN